MQIHKQLIKKENKLPEQVRAQIIRYAGVNFEVVHFWKTGTSDYYVVVRTEDVDDGDIEEFFFFHIFWSELTKRWMTSVDGEVGRKLEHKSNPATWYKVQ